MRYDDPSVIVSEPFKVNRKLSGNLVASRVLKK